MAARMTRGFQRRWVQALVAIQVAAMVSAPAVSAQVGPGMFDRDAGDAPSIGETSQRFIDDPSASDNPSIGESSGETDFPEAGDAPSIGGANRPFEQPGEGAPDGRLRPFGD